MPLKLRPTRAEGNRNEQTRRLQETARSSLVSTQNCGIYTGFECNREAAPQPCTYKCTVSRVILSISVSRDFPARWREISALRSYNEKMKLSQDKAPDFRCLLMQLWGWGGGREGKLCSEEEKREGSTKQQEGLGGWEAMRWKTEKCQEHHTPLESRSSVLHNIPQRPRESGSGHS